MMIDIDFFKNYNDTYGHNEGDKCLRAVAKALTDGITRSDDFVARYGGEEFVVVLPNTEEGGARLIANKLLENVRDCKIPHTHSVTADHVTVSIGVTTGNVGHTQVGEEYVKRADEMLYKSKNSGRNRYNFETL
jgi:diguanylate cyclase (GGDEF)-like protein